MGEYQDVRGGRAGGKQNGMRGSSSYILGFGQDLSVCSNGGGGNSLLSLSYSPTAPRDSHQFVNIAHKSPKYNIQIQFYYFTSSNRPGGGRPGYRHCMCATVELEKRTFWSRSEEEKMILKKYVRTGVLSSAYA